MARDEIMRKELGIPRVAQTWYGSFNLFRFHNNHSLVAIWQSAIRCTCCKVVKRRRYNTLPVNCQPLVLIFNLNHDKNCKLKQLNPVSDTWKNIR
jgi:hypothetical protein